VIVHLVGLVFNIYKRHGENDVKYMYFVFVPFIYTGVCEALQIPRK
jgi:hypothetical protein